MRKFLLSSLVALSCLVLIACASTGNQSDGASNGGGDGNGEQITIRWVDFQNTDATNKAIAELIAAYEAENSNVKIERSYVPISDINNQLLMGSAASNLPDIVWLDNPDHQSFAAAGILADITDYVEEWGEAEKYFEGPMSSAMYDGRYYGIPNSSNNLGLFYNADLLEEAGVEPPTNWEELVEAARALTKDGVYGLAVSAVKHEMGTFQFLPFVYQAGADVTDFNHGGTVEAISLWKDLYDEGLVSREILNMNQNDIMLQFTAGNVAMVVNGTWNIPTLRNEPPDFNWDVTTLPEHKEGGTILGGENWAITANSEHVEIAWDIIRFAQQADYSIPYSQAAGRIPSRTDYVEDPFWQEDEQFRVFADSMEVAKARAYGPNYPQISLAIQDMLHEVLSGQKSAEDAVTDAANKIDPLLP